MNKAYYLSTCSTCKKILKEVSLPESIQLQDIKTNKISLEQLKEMKDLAGSYEALFSRRAMKYKSMGLKDKTLTENDYKKLILEEYTFLKRPVILIDRHIFIGSSPKTITALASFLKEYKVE
ncbi:MAG: ArsC/Spx/MgsR family protein [Vicingaceae bacterium]